MKKHLFAAMTALALTAFSAANVQAQDFEMKPYAGVGLGAFGLEWKGTNGFLMSQKNTVFGGYAKFGVDIGDYLGAELRIGTTGSGTKSFAAGTPWTSTTVLAARVDSKVQATSIVSYLAKAQFPVTPDLKLYALLGATTAKLKLTFSGPGALGSLSSSATKTGFTYGVGGEYFVQDALSVGVEWVQYWTNVKTGTNTKAKLWGAVATAAYHF